MKVWKKWDRFLSWFSWLVLGAEVAQLIGENKQTILDKLRLERRVTEAVDGMSVATFQSPAYPVRTRRPIGCPR